MTGYGYSVKARRPWEEAVGLQAIVRFHALYPAT